MKRSPVDHFASFDYVGFYHVYNRTNNKERLFLDDDDRRNFLKKFDAYLGPFVDTFAYCLMGNHFHILIAVKPEATIVSIINAIPKADQTVIQKQFLAAKDADRSVHDLISAQFSRFFTSYSTLFNLKYGRAGNLFHRRFKRILVTSERHLIWLVFYINSNPTKHNVIENFKNYPWSSFLSLASDKPTKLKRERVWAWFGGKEAFLQFHSRDKKGHRGPDYFEVEQ